MLDAITNVIGASQALRVVPEGGTVETSMTLNQNAVVKTSAALERVSRVFGNQSLISEFTVARREELAATVSLENSSLT